MAEQSKPTQLAIAEAIHLLQTFRSADLTQTIYKIEKSLKGVSAQNYSAVLATSGAKAEALGAAGLIKQLAGQINVVIHALGILLCLPHILRPGEVIDYVSLGAGNTGRAFDLETSLRVTEATTRHKKSGSKMNRSDRLELYSSRATDSPTAIFLPK
jgi:3-hydroxy-3-methylglutaryl CoA synthase